MQRGLHIHPLAQSSDAGTLLAHQVLDDCVAVFPSFRRYWAESGWYFHDKSGSYNACGVLLLLTWLLYERFNRVSDRQWHRLGALAKKYFDMGEPTRGVVGACLIEPLEKKPYLRKMLRHWEREMLRHFTVVRA